VHFPIQLRIELRTGGPLVDEPVHLPVRPERAALLRSPLLPTILAGLLAQQPVEEAVEGPERDRPEGFLRVVLEPRAIPTLQIVSMN
jgi:hypothetical protein